MEIQRVSLIGLGAMGSFFAPRLYSTLGDRFTVIAEGARKERLKNKGVTLNGTTWHFPIAEPSEKQEDDLILIAVKETALDQALEDIQHRVGPRTQILCILNGVESEERVAARYGWDHVLYSFMRISIVMEDGTADFDPNAGKVYFGEKVNESPYTERVSRIARLFDRCHIPYVIEEDMIQALWFKYMCNIGENMTCALLGIPFGYFRWNDEANAIRRAAMEEVAAIAQAMGIAIGAEEMAKQEKVLPGIPYDNKPSTLQDLEHGRKTEVEMFSGTVVRMGQKLGIPTPLNWMLWKGIRVLEAKNQEKKGD